VSTTRVDGSQSTREICSRQLVWRGAIQFLNIPSSRNWMVSQPTTVRLLIFQVDCPTVCQNPHHCTRYQSFYAALSLFYREHYLYFPEDADRSSPFGIRNAPDKPATLHKAYFHSTPDNRSLMAREPLEVGQRRLSLVTIVALIFSSLFTRMGTF
jgi:hypothetical protein